MNVTRFSERPEIAMAAKVQMIPNEMAHSGSSTPRKERNAIQPTIAISR